VGELTDKQQAIFQQTPNLIAARADYRTELKMRRRSSLRDVNMG
jgi:hypothetical protein